jgi:hypothetical protein
VWGALYGGGKASGQGQERIFHGRIGDPADQSQRAWQPNGPRILRRAQCWPNRPLTGGGSTNVGSSRCGGGLCRIPTPPSTQDAQLHAPRLLLIILAVLAFVALWILDTQALLELGAWYAWHDPLAAGGSVGLIALGAGAVIVLRPWRRLVQKPGRSTAARRNVSARRKRARAASGRPPRGKKARGR